MNWIIYIMTAGAAVCAGTYDTASDAACAAAWLMADGYHLEIIKPDHFTDDIPELEKAFA